MNPRTTYGGSETFDAETGSVSASQLLRQTADATDTSISEESDIDYKQPFVPDCTENSNIATANDWKTSQFVDAVKYYYLRQQSLEFLGVTVLRGAINDTVTDIQVGSNAFVRGNKIKVGSEEMFVRSVIPAEASGISTLTVERGFNSTTAASHSNLSGVGFFVDDLNVMISEKSWNNNLDNSIRKWFFVEGVIGSTNAGAAATVSSVVNNLSLRIIPSGAIYGDSGEPGTEGVDYGSGVGIGGTGGTALSWTATGNTNNYILLDNGSKLYAGGGGGGQGGSGGGGGRGGSGGVNNIFCQFGPNATCGLDGGIGGPGGARKPGAAGGEGAGYENQSPDLVGGPGGERNGGGGYNGPAGNGGSGGPSGKNTAGGPGGNFGQSGTDRTDSVGSTGSPGPGGTVNGTSTNCGGNGVPPPGYTFYCGGYSTSGENGSAGTAGKEAGPGGSSIVRSTIAKPYTLIGDDTDTFKGPENIA